MTTEPQPQPQSARPDYYRDADGRDVVDGYIDEMLNAGAKPSTVAREVMGFYSISTAKYAMRYGAKGDPVGDANKIKECGSCAVALADALDNGTVTAEWLRSNEWRRG